MHRASLSQQEDRVLGRVLRAQADKVPDDPYLLSGDSVYSYGRVNELANAYASGLAGLGIARGDSVALLMETCPEFAFTSFAANKLGAIWVPTNVDYKGAWLRETLEDSRARVLVADAALLPRVAELGGELPFDRVVVRGDLEGLELGVPTLPLAEFANLSTDEPDPGARFYGDTAAVLWTSGTTGRSKPGSSPRRAPAWSPPAIPRAPSSTPAASTWSA